MDVDEFAVDDVKTELGSAESQCVFMGSGSFVDRRIRRCVRSNVYGSYPAQSKKYFNIVTDITMLKTAIEINPWENGSEYWNAVIEELRRKHSFYANGRQVTDRCSFLLKKYKDNTLSDLNRSGTQQQYDERQNLCEKLSNAVHFSALSSSGNESTSNDNLQPQMQQHGGVDVICRERDDATATSCSNDSNLDDKESEEIVFRRKRKRHRVLSEAVLRNAELDLELKQEEYQLRFEQQRFEMEFRRRQLDLEERRLKIEEERQREATFHRQLVSKLITLLEKRHSD